MALQGSSITRSAGGTMSRSGYFGLIGGLLVAGFGLTALTAWLGTTPAFMSFAASNPLVFGIGLLVATIAGMVIIGVGTHKQSVGLTLAGYVLFAVSFGATTSILLPYYNLNTITEALVLTAGIALLFTALGILFPNAMEKAAMIAAIVLIGVLIASLVMFFFGGIGGWVDYVVVGVFAIFIGYDTHKAAQLEPTVVNAIMSATNIFVDIVNLFLRILSILDRD